MNSYLFEKIGQARRDAFISEAAANRLAAEVGAAERTIADRAHAGFWASVRRAFAAPPGMSFLPRLAGYPTARR